MGGHLIQIYASFVVGLGSVIYSCMLFWPSDSLPKLKSDKTLLDQEVTEYYESVIGSLPMMGSLMATLFSGVIIENFGRKKCQILSALLIVLGWCLIVTTKSMSVLMVARFLLGLSSGIQVLLTSMMIGELVSDNIRGVLMTFPVFGFNLGCLTVYLLGWFCTYQVTNYVILTIGVAFAVMTCTIKETPVFLLKKGREKDALAALKFYRGTSETTQQILDEFDVIKSSLDAPVEMKTISEKLNVEESEKLEAFLENEVGEKKKSQSAWVFLYKSKTTHRGLLLTTSLVLFLSLMGNLAIQTYAADFFMKAAPSLSPNVCSLILAVSNMVGCTLSMMFIDSMGRRILQISSCAINSTCLFLLATILRWSWAPIWAVPVLMVISCAITQFGAGSVPAVMMGEAFVPEVKSLATTITIFVMMLSNFVLLAAFGPTVLAFGLDGAFFIFGCIAALATLVSYMLTPETSGLDANAVQELFAKGWMQCKHSRRK